MSQIDLQVTLGDDKKERALDIITNLNSDLDTLDDRVSRLESEGITLQLKVEKGEVVATLKES